MVVGWSKLFKFYWHKLNSELGLLGWLGIFGVVFGSLILWQTYQSVKQVPSLTQQVLQKKLRLNAMPTSKQVPVNELQLPKAEEYERTLKEILHLTEKHSIILVGGSYTVKTLQNSRIKIVEVTFPLSGSYLQSKRFLAELLNTIPHSSLQAVRFSQPNRTNELLDVEAVLLLYFLRS